MSKVIRWLCVVLPPPWVLLVCSLLYVALEALAAWLHWWLGVPRADAGFLGIRSSLFAVACAGYGLFRVWAFHPVFHNDYVQWLTQTPWTSRKPLPAGPVHLVPQDGIVLAAVLLLLHGWPERFAVVPLVFLTGYLVCMCLSLWLTGRRWMVYTLAFGLGLVLRLAAIPVAALCVAVLLYPLAYVGLRRSLACFPWQKHPWWEEFLASFRKQTLSDSPAKREDMPLQPRLGWPYDRLRPGTSIARIGYADGLLISLLAGWWAHAGAMAIREDDTPTAPLLMLYLYVCLGLLVMRLFVYCWGYLPPISLWGRIVTLRWIIPGYDQVFIAPIGILLVGAGAPVGLLCLGLSPEIAIPVSLFMTLSVGLSVGPTLRGWQLTGHHRIVPGIRKTQEFHQL